MTRMTREEASFILANIDRRVCDDELSEALDMAIKALQQQKVGEWCTQSDGNFEWYECSECGYVVESEVQHSGKYDARTNYCPYCGAKMAESEDKE